jgi:hypothetical protein
VHVLAEDVLDEGLDVLGVDPHVGVLGRSIQCRGTVLGLAHAARTVFSGTNSHARNKPGDPSALTQDDTADYLRTRLRLAGCDRELFHLDALALLHEYADGSLRDIDRLATAALRDAARKKRKTVDAETLQRVLGADGKEAT